MSRMQDLLHLCQLISSADGDQLQRFVLMLPENELRDILLSFVHHTMLTLYSRFTQQKFESIIDAGGINEDKEPIDSTSSKKNRKDPNLEVFKHKFNEKEQTQVMIANMQVQLRQVGVETFPALVCSSTPDSKDCLLESVCDDLWHHIFTFVDFTSRHLSKSTCRSWYQWASHPSSVYYLPFSWRVRLVPRLVKGIWKLEDFKHVRRLEFCHYSCLRPTDCEHREALAQIFDACKQLEVVDLSQSDLYQPIVIPQTIASLIEGGRLVKTPSESSKKLILHHGERVYSNTRLSSTNIPFLSSLMKYFDDIEIVDSDPDMSNLARISLYGQDVKDMFTRASWISSVPLTAVNVALSLRNLRQLRLEWSVICNWFCSEIAGVDFLDNARAQSTWRNLKKLTLDVAHVLSPEAEQHHQHDRRNDMCSRSLVSFLQCAPHLDSIRVVQVYRYSLGERPGKKDHVFQVVPYDENIGQQLQQPCRKIQRRRIYRNPFAMANLCKLQHVSVEMAQFSARGSPMNAAFTLLLRRLQDTNVSQLNLTISPQCYYGQIRGNEGGDVSVMWSYLRGLVQQGMVDNLMFLKIRINLEIKLNWKNTPRFLDECLQVINAVSARLPKKAHVFHFVVENKSPSTSHLVNFHSQSRLIQQIFSNFATLASGSNFKDLRVVHPFASKQPSEQAQSTLLSSFPGVNWHKCGFDWRQTSR